MNNNTCHICNENRPHIMLSQLTNIQSLVRHIEPTKNYRYHFNWNVNFRCKYGLRCTKYNHIETRIASIIDDIEGRLVTIALENDDIYYRVITLLRGYFPSVCTELNRIYKN